MTQEKLAERLSLSLTHMAKVETGKRRCSIEILIEIAALFDVTLDFLVFGKVDPQQAAKDKLKSIIRELTFLERNL